jgi:hypothetical protein
MLFMQKTSKNLDVSFTEMTQHDQGICFGVLTILKAETSSAV